MKITLIALAVLFALLALYFLLNLISLKQNKINNLIKLSSRKSAALYMLCCLALVPALGYGLKFYEEQQIAQAKGFDTYKAYRAELAKAESFGLPLKTYQLEMKKAAKLNIHNYQDYVDLLEAQDNGYEDFASYQEDVNLAHKYGFPLHVYTYAKEDAAEKNFADFDAYLVDREKKLLASKMEQIVRLEGDYNIESVPLGVDKNELLATIDNCKISQIPDYAFPVTKSLAPRSEALVGHFFPETKTNSNFGLNVYTMNFTAKPGLDRQVISKYEMKCDNSRYDLWFLNSDNSLVMYEKTIHFPNIRKHDDTVSRLTQVLTEKCDSDITVGLDTSFEEHGTRKVTNLYCKNFQDYIITTIVDGETIAGVRQDPDIHIGYLSDRLWKKYIDNVRRKKAPNEPVSFSQTRARNKTKTFESRI